MVTAARRVSAKQIAVLALFVSLGANVTGISANGRAVREQCRQIENLKTQNRAIANLTIRQLNELEENFKQAFGEEPTVDKIRSREQRKRVVLPRYRVEMNKQLAIHEEALRQFAPIECHYPILIWKDK